MVPEGPSLGHRRHYWELWSPLGTLVTQKPLGGDVRHLPTRGLCWRPHSLLSRWVRFWDGGTGASRLVDSQEGLRTELGAHPHSHQCVEVGTSEGSPGLGYPFGLGDGGRPRKVKFPGLAGLRVGSKAAGGDGDWRRQTGARPGGDMQ